MLGKHFSFILIPCCFALISGCTLPKDEQLVNNDGNSEGCLFGVNEGEEAEYHLLRQNDLSTAAFGRKYEHNLLKGILKASLAATIPFIDRTGVTVYKAPATPHSNCQQDNMAAASQAPTHIQSKWNQATLDDSASSGVTMGLYLSQNSLNSNQAALFVRSNAGRHTLVHEFMHHLFSKQSEADGFDEMKNKVDMKVNAARLSAVMKEISQSSSLTSEKALELLKITQAYVQGMDRMLLNFTLEEVAIEKLLANAYNKQELKYTKKNSEWYLVSKSKSAKEDYDSCLKIVEVTKDLIAPTLGIRPEIAELKSLILKRTLELNQIRQEFPSSYWHSSLKQLSSMEKSGENEDHVGCAHSHDRYLDEIRAIAPKL